MNVAPSQVDTVVLSHLHFDHTGGLFALLGLRLQVPGPGNLTIYGPPGTREMVEGLLAAEASPARMLTAVGPDPTHAVDPVADVSIVELTGGDTVEIGPIELSAAQNTHYSNIEPGSPDDATFQSLSYRFELPGWSIGFTGDTGPSPNMSELLVGVDLLVSEVIDPDAALATVLRQRPDLPRGVQDYLFQHFLDEHLIPQEIGRIAEVNHVGMVVLSHNALGEGSESEALAGIAESYAGPVRIANDLDQFAPGL